MTQLSAVSIDRIEADERAYMRQSMSTPCLNSIVDAEGCYITDVNGHKYLDFHGNSIHQIGYKNPYVTEAVKNSSTSYRSFQEDLRQILR